MITLVSSSATAVAATPDAHVATAQGKRSYAWAGGSTGAPGLVPGRVLFVPSSQAYYWTPKWQLGEAEADADIRAGRVRSFDTMDDAIAALFEDE